MALLVEVGHYLLLLAGIALWPGQLTVDHLIGLFALAGAVKAGGLWWHFRKVVLKGWSRPRLPYFAHAFTFFLIGFSGTLNSRIDLYSVSYFLSAGEVGQYQILVNLLLYIQALSNFILLPFVKGLYRLDASAIFKPDSKADLLVFGNAERAIVEIAHRLAKGEKISDIRDLRGTAFMVPRGWAARRRMDGHRLDRGRYAGAAGPPCRSLRHGIRARSAVDRNCRRRAAGTPGRARRNAWPR